MWADRSAPLAVTRGPPHDDDSQYRDGRSHRRPQMMRGRVPDRWNGDPCAVVSMLRRSLTGGRSAVSLCRARGRSSTIRIVVVTDSCRSWSTVPHPIATDSCRRHTRFATSELLLRHGKPETARDLSTESPVTDLMAAAGELSESFRNGRLVALLPPEYACVRHVRGTTHPVGDGFLRYRHTRKPSTTWALKRGFSWSGRRESNPHHQLGRLRF